MKRFLVLAALVLLAPAGLVAPRGPDDLLVEGVGEGDGPEGGDALTHSARHKD